MTVEKMMVGVEDIGAAQKFLAGQVHRTPVVTSAYFGDQVGVKLFLKLELFQKTGSFKPRGVLTKLNHLSTAEKQKGVITLSAGNHAQALAWAARQAGIHATVVMPATAVRSKLEAARGYGAEIVQTEADLLTTCLAIQKERDLTLVHPFDDPWIIAGQGTVGLEILEDVPDVDAVIVGVGGGGLISGIATAIKSNKPTVKLFGVEPEGASAMLQSLQQGKPLNLGKVSTIADGLAAPFAGENTFKHVKAYVDSIVTVSDHEIAAVMRPILERCKIMAEPAAASTIAGLLSGKLDLPKGGSVVCVISGGNVDLERLKQLI